MTKTANDIIQIVRNATGRNDKTDPMFTDQVILGYINDFYTLEMGQELRLKEKRTWWEFDYGPDVANYSNPLPVNLEAPFGAPSTPQQVQYTTIGPLCYADGFKVFWYEDPKTFYAI